MLITGAPGSGKTTAVRKIAERLEHLALHGFYTEELRHRGERRGFRAVTFDGAQCTIAHVDLRGPARVGKYGVDVAAIDGLAASALGGRPDVYLVDEIGKMECLSPAFVAAVRDLLDGVVPVVGTVGLRGSGLIAEVKRRPDAELWTLDRSNRDDIPARAVEWLARRR